MSSSHLHKKRERSSESFTVTLGKLPHGYYYISDSLMGGTKIKISMIDLSNNKEDQNKYQQNDEEETTSDILSLDPQILKDELPQIITNIQNNETEQIYLPISSGWFNFDNIHEIEIKSLPEFFCGKYPSKTPEIYKLYRNFIINLYRENSSMYLTSSTCRKHLAGDACAILRIHAFLEHWGLINFKLNKVFKPNTSFLPKAFNFKSPIYIDTNYFLIDNNFVNNFDNNNIIITNSKNKKIRTLYPINNISTKNLKYLNFAEENSQKTGIFKKINFLMKNYRPKCDICGNLCTINWYIPKENIEDINEDNDSDINIDINVDSENENKDFCLICEYCYNNNDVTFPNNLKKENFELSSIYNLLSKDKLNNKIVEKLNEENWTDEQNKKLLDVLKNENDKKWEDVIQSLGKEINKTKDECILHLLQMPLSNYEVDEDKDNNEEKIEEIEEIKESSNNIENNNSEVIKIEENKTENNEKEIKEENKTQDNNKNGKNEEVKVNDEKKEIEVKKDNKKEEDQKDNNKKEDNKKEENKKKENKKEENESLGEMIKIFNSLFKKYLNEDNQNEKISNEVNNKSFKETIYKVFAKSIDRCHELKKEEKKEMEKIMDMLVYLQMEKIEMKMNYFSQFEKIIEYKKSQLKMTENKIIKDRIQLLTQQLLLQQKMQKMQKNENK